MGKAASFVFQVEIAALPVNQIDSQIWEVIFITAVTVCKHNTGILGVMQML